MSDYVETGKEACCYCGEDFPEEMDPVRQSSDGVVFPEWFDMLVIHPRKGDKWYNPETGESGEI